MTIKDLYTYVLKNNGATYCPLTKQLFNPNHGFMVSNYGTEFILDLDKLTPSVFAEVIDNNIIMEDEYVGIWINDEQLYFDVSTYWSNLKSALIEGITNEQKVIWDFQQNKTIALPSDQRNGTTTQQLEYRAQAIEKMINNYPECKWY
jgi:hypothetical protein